MAVVVRTCATLRLWGDDLLPDEVTALLGCNPSSARRKGDPMRIPPSHPPSRTGIWSLSTERSEGDALDEQIASILSSLSQELTVWTSLAEKFDMDMFCGIWLDEPGQGLALCPSTLESLGCRRIRLELDIYYADSGQPVVK